ncbi:IS1182 family transposase [Rhabdobacter roseus]|uniref:Transposase n=1 Tax=Rhabdobacter roseus TaxID=1655419 RepID=A0A840TXK7_9BACT|nr:IS1182 family transposase [Rhabdobacter roseus]MBB5287665.1 transposase [Rhabdobacter roseus]
MQGRQQIQPKLFYQLNLEQLVPADNFYRGLSQCLDLHFLYPATAEYYGSEGQQSIDPVVFFKMLLVGYLNNINSDRKLIAFCSNCLDVRLFLKYDLDEALPWHSTISRTRQLYGQEVFLKLFREVLRLCVGKGMVRAKRQAVDSAFIKANASMDSLLEKEVVEDASAYVDELEEGSEFKVSSGRKKRVERHHKWKEQAYKDMPGHVDDPKQVDDQGNTIRPKYLSNHTHYSPTDPDAKISTKPGKARQLNYSGQLAVDDAHHVITGACASTAGSRDSENLPQILDQTLENLQGVKLTLDQITADAGYSSGKALRYCQEKGIDAYIPNFGQYKPEREGFVYHADKDEYRCEKPGGKGAVLTFKGIKTDSKGYQKKSYRSSETVCGSCLLREPCCGKATKFKKLEESIDKPYYDRMHQKLAQNPAYTKRISKIRSRTVEPVLGTLVNFLNMRRINSRGMAQANKHVMMAALTYNLKKYLNFSRKKVQPALVALRKGLNPFQTDSTARFSPRYQFLSF